MAEPLNRSMNLVSGLGGSAVARAREGSTESPDALLSDSTRAAAAHAFETLLRHYAGRMRAVARRFFPDAEDCADAVQDALLAAYRAIDSFEGNSSIWTWFYRILVNACISIQRSRCRRRLVRLADIPGQVEEHLSGTKWGRRGTESAHTHVARAETLAQVRLCIQHLPEHFRQVLLLRDIEELDIDQTAERLGTSRSAVKSRLHRARQALRVSLEPLLRTSA